MGMIGFDTLGYAHPLFPRKLFCDLAPAGSALGAFHSEFSLLTPHIRWTEAHYPGKFPVWRIQIWWGGNNHAIVPTNFLRDACVLYEQLAKEFPKTKFYLSHSCEYRGANSSEIRKRFTIMAKTAPSCLRVDCPENNDPMKGPTGETHDPFKTIPNPYIASTDGKNIYDIDAERSKRTHRSAVINYLWGARFNLRQITDAGDPVLPPLERKAAPGPRYIRAIIRLAKPIGDAPKAFPGAIPITKPCLYKSHSEDSANKDGTLNQDPRNNKPVLIVEGIKTPYEVITCEGEVLGHLAYGGDYKDGLCRYYSGIPGGVNMYGYELGEKALMQSGHEFVWFRQGSKIYGPVNPAFRTGYYLY